MSEGILKNPKSLSENNTKLSLIEKQIDEIDDLHSLKLINLEVLYLSNNNLRNIDNICQFQNLKSLSLTCNKIDSVENLKILQNLQNLESLRLEGNPISNLFPNFREVLICLLPQIKNLDGKTINDNERKGAQIICAKQNSLIEMLFNLNLTLSMIQNISAKINLHSHLQKLGYAIDQSLKPNIDLILRYSSPSNFEQYHFYTWFEKEYLFNQ